MKWDRIRTVQLESEKLKHQFSQVEGDLNSKGDP
jgi:hypothetical protein